MKRLAIVLPCYNEESALPYTFDALSKILNTLISDGKISSDSYMLCVDDGSKDRTWEVIEAEQKTNPYVKGVKTVHLLNYVPFTKKEMIETLASEYGYARFIEL